MQIPWPFRLRTPESAYKPNLSAASESQFQLRQIDPLNVVRTPGQPRQERVYIVSPDQAPFARTRTENFTFAFADVPALTVGAGPSGHVCIVGGKRENWFLRFSASGEGNSEAEALERTNQVSLVRSGATVALCVPDSLRSLGMRSQLIVEGPEDASVTVHGSFAPVEVRNMAGPIRIAAIRARATILNTTGQVDACAPMLDFAASEGHVILSAEWEINLKLLSDSFRGSLTAWAQRTVRVLIPQTFRSAFRIVVNRPQDCVCRTKFREQLKQEQKGGLIAFTFAGDGKNSPEAIELRSEHAQVVIDGF